MKIVVIAVVGLGVALALVLGFDRGFDAASVTILVLIAMTGALAISAVARSEGGAVGPAYCSECDGVISPNAPYCKHCGAPAG